MWRILFVGCAYAARSEGITDIDFGGIKIRVARLHDSCVKHGICTSVSKLFSCVVALLHYVVIVLRLWARFVSNLRSFSTVQVFRFCPSFCWCNCYAIGCAPCNTRSAKHILCPLVQSAFVRTRHATIPEVSFERVHIRRHTKVGTNVAAHFSLQVTVLYDVATVATDDKTCYGSHDGLGHRIVCALDRSAVSHPARDCKLSSCRT